MVEPIKPKALTSSYPVKPEPDRDTYMDTYTEGASLPDIMKHIEPDAMARRVQLTAEEELRLLGEKLVREVYKNTPKGTGNLARSTKYRILPMREAIGKEPMYTLEIIQDATSIQSGAVSPGKRYFYWYTVHHGLQPDGKLRQVRPPSVKQGTLYPWVTKVVPTLDPEYATSAIAWNIYKFGLKPNPYLRISFNNKQQDISATQEKIGKAIIFDLNDLPDVQYHYGRQQRGFN